MGRLHGGHPVHTCGERGRGLPAAGGPVVLALTRGVGRVFGHRGRPVGLQRAGTGAGGLAGQRVLASSPALLREGVLVGHT